MEEKLHGIQLLKRIIVNLGFPANFWSMAGISLALIGLSFALYLPKLGFYLDDWPQLYSLAVHGTEGIKTYFLFDGRPFGWGPTLLFYKIWGTNPIGWHITNYLLRWFVGLGIWVVFMRLWPGHKREIFWSVLLFAVYPSFNQQSMGVMFVPHWSCYLAFVLSMWLMLLAIRNDRWRIPLLLLSLAVNTTNLVTTEYFIGAEFIRPVLLWLALRSEYTKNRLRKTLLTWLPFLFLAGFYIIWRLFLMENLRGLYPVFFSNLITSPGSTLIHLVNLIIRDTSFVIMGTWFPALNPAQFDLSTPYLVIGYFLAVVVAVLLFTLLQISKKEDISEEKMEYRKFALETMAVGFAGILLGCGPGWLIGASATNAGLWNDRFSLPAMWAASLFIVGFLTLLLRENRFRREMIFVILIAVAVGWNFAVTNDYKWSTTWQNRFFSQLKWRVPGLKPNTSILADNELFTKVGVYPTSFMFNLFYPTEQAMPALDHWFFTIHKYFPDNAADLGEGIEVTQGHWYAKYKADSRDSLVIAWNRTNTDCLWVLSSNDKYNPLISENTKKALSASNLTRIVTEGAVAHPDENLFGRENRNTWCYYYERADLARQLGDWNKVLSIYEEAGTAGYSVSNGVELMPFIEAYARTGNADVAQDLTMLAKALTPHLRDYMCDNWNRIAKDMSGDQVFDEEYQAYSNQDLCWEVK